MSRCHRQPSGFGRNCKVYQFVKLLTPFCLSALLNQSLILKMFNLLSKLYSFDIIKYSRFWKYQKISYNWKLLNWISQYPIRKIFSYLIFTIHSTNIISDGCQNKQKVIQLIYMYFSKNLIRSNIVSFYITNI